MTPKNVIFTRWTAVFLLIATVIMIAFISSGVFDPEPIGNLQWQKRMIQTIPSQSQQITWLADVPDGDFSVRLTAVYQSGELDSQYGLIVGHNEDYFAVTIAPTGFTTIWQQSSLQPVSRTLHPFAPWPHVQTGSVSNEIWLDRVNGRVTVRINREILWQGEVAVMSEVGVMGESWGETAVVHFSSIQLFSP